MPEHIRALIILLLLSTSVLSMARKHALNVLSTKDFGSFRLQWIGLLVIAFLSHNFWLYTILGLIFLIYQYKSKADPLALFFIGILAIPNIGYQIPGLGLVNYLFELNNIRFLILVLLLPAYISLTGKHGTPPFGKLLTDKIIITYISINIALQLRDTSITDTARQALYYFIDIILPYYVFSRHPKDLNSFQKIFMSFVISASLLAIIGTFETTTKWMLYESLREVWGRPSTFSPYGAGQRAGLLRANASVGNIPLGYIMAIAIGFMFFIGNIISKPSSLWVGLSIFTIGLLSALSRGPWVGALIVVLAYISTGRQAIKRIILIALISLISLPIISILPGGDKIIGLIPYIGDTGQDTISYRENLLQNSLLVIQRNLWFGSTDYLSTPEMQMLIQGQGIIDLVNTYLQIALSSGVVGLSLFVGFFLSILWGIYKSMKMVSDQSSHVRLLGRTLLASLIGILFIIFTVSSVSIIPIVYWSVAGLGVAYAQMVREHHKATQAKPAA